MKIKVCDYKSAKQFIQQNSSATLVSKTYKNQREKMDFICECGEPFSTCMDAFIRSNVRQCNGCGYSNGARKNALSHEEFMKRAEKLIGDDFEIHSGKYENQKSIFTIYHKKCNDTFPRRAVKILEGHNECGVCGSNVKRTREQVQEEINSFSDEIEVVEYHGTDNVIVRHIVCNTVVSRAMSEIRKHRGFHCPKCKSSYGTRLISKYLNENDIDFVREYKFLECKNIKELPFDFYIKSLNTCIEFDGDHHDRVLYHWGGEKQFKNVQKNDRIKNEFCIKNNIHLIRIKYIHQDNIEEILNKHINRTIPR